MNMKILVHIGFLYLLKLTKLFILIVLVENIFLKKLINLLVTSKALVQKHVIKKIKASTFRIQAYDSIMCGYFSIEFINYMLKGKTLFDYTNLFSPNDFKKNDRVIKRTFKKGMILQN